MPAKGLSDKGCLTMRLHVVNPNTTASMTAKIAAAARASPCPTL